MNNGLNKIDLSSSDLAPDWVKNKDKSEKSNIKIRQNKQGKFKKDNKFIRNKRIKKKFTPKHRSKPSFKKIDGLFVNIEPTAQSLNELEKHIKKTFQSYSVLELSKFILKDKSRFQLKIESKNPNLSFFVNKLNFSVFLTKEEAIWSVINSSLLREFYNIEESVNDKEVGSFSSIAVCGLSGEILCPSNYHEYQKKISNLHMKKYSYLSISEYKSKIKIIKDEELINKWKNNVKNIKIYIPKSNDESSEDDDKKNDFTIKNQDDLFFHFSKNFANNVIENKKETTIPAIISEDLVSRDLIGYLNFEISKIRRGFPISIIKFLTRFFEDKSFKIFRYNKKELYVSRIRHQIINTSNKFSSSIELIIELIKNNEKINLLDLIKLCVKGFKSFDKGNDAEINKKALNILKDVRWLISEGYVVEFQDTSLIIAKPMITDQDSRRSNHKRRNNSKNIIKNNDSINSFTVGSYFSKMSNHGLNDYEYDMEESVNPVLI